MSETTWKFKVSAKTGNKDRVTSIGVRISDSHEFKELAHLLGLVGVESKYNMGDQCNIDIELPEDSPELSKILIWLEENYGFVPSKHRIVPKGDRDHIFGLKKSRSYTKRDLDQCELLYIWHVDKIIGEHKQRTPEQIEAEIYLAYKGKRKKAPQFGTLMPFHALAMSEELKAELGKVGLQGLGFEQVVDGDGLWRMRSQTLMPATKIPLQNDYGEVVSPDDYSEKSPAKVFDDKGYWPVELRYDRDEVQLLGEFDIADTYERTGNSPLSAYRYHVVSQKFRKALDGLGVKGVNYAPVILE